MRSLQLLAFFAIPFLFSCQQTQEQALFGFASADATEQGRGGTTAKAENIIFQSKDGGKTWQDISAGLPVDIKPWLFFAGEGELFLGDDKDNYKSSTAANSTNWEKEIAMQQQLISISENPSGPIAINNDGQFFQKLNGTDVWMPIFTDFKSSLVRKVFTTKDGNTFITSDDGLFKSVDGGKTWKHVMQDGWVLKLAESDGVLLCTNTKGILRSTDSGENWDIVLSEGGVGIDVTPINSGFAAINYSTSEEIRHVQSSTDGGKTWQRIDVNLPPSKLISSIRQMGEYLYCGHPEGIYRSADLGKTWQLVVPTIGKKVFNLFVAGDVIYAVLREGGC